MLICPFTQGQIDEYLTPNSLEEFIKKIKTFPDRVEREVRFPNIADKIMVIIGMRRAGLT